MYKVLGTTTKRVNCFRPAVLLIFILILFAIFYHGRGIRKIVIASNEAPLPPQPCGCQRQLPLTGSSNDALVLFNQTTCGADSYRRGSHQNVVAYSFYGSKTENSHKNKLYFEGILGNLELMRKFYDGWVMRLYHDLEADDPMLKDICNLLCSHDNLDICNVRDLPGVPFKDASKTFPMIWRFFPTLDPQVDVYLCRDLDSRFNNREFFAVKEWLESDEPLHAMRDHPAHGVPYVGCCWGANLSRKNSRALWVQTWKKILASPKAWAKRNAKSQYGPDQEILAEILWADWGRRMTFQHDAYTCARFPGSIGYPTKREEGPYNYVQAVHHLNQEGSTLTEKCPKSCRRNVEWEYC